MNNFDKLLDVASSVDLPDFLILVQAVLQECGDLSSECELNARAYYRCVDLINSVRETAIAVLQTKKSES